MAKIEKALKTALTSVDSSNLSSLSSNLSKIAEVLIKINERQQRKFKLEEKLLTVSYTHLTLPTIYSV